MSASSVRYFALGIGIIFVIIALMGLLGIGLQPPAPGEPVPMMNSQYGYVLGLFPVNLLHNLVHLIIGVAGIAAYRRYSSARTYCRALAIFYGLLTVMGLIPGLNTMFGLVPIFGNDVWLHLISAVAAAIFGWAPVSEEAGATTYDQTTDVRRSR
jgi:hypothetical protein